MITFGIEMKLCYRTIMGSSDRLNSDAGQMYSVNLPAMGPARMAKEND
jgi:hypothetical protein